MWEDMLHLGDQSHVTDITIVPRSMITSNQECSSRWLPGLYSVQVKNYLSSIESKSMITLVQQYPSQWYLGSTVPKSKITLVQQYTSQWLPWFNSTQVDNDLSLTVPKSMITLAQQYPSQQWPQFNSPQINDHPGSTVPKSTIAIALQSTSVLQFPCQWLPWFQSTNPALCLSIIHVNNRISATHSKWCIVCCKVQSKRLSIFFDCRKTNFAAHLPKTDWARHIWITTECKKWLVKNPQGEIERYILLINWYTCIYYDICYT